MSDPVADFEQACKAAGVSPTAALREGGVHPTMWWRWKRNVSPTLRKLDAAHEGLRRLADKGGAA